MHTFARCLIKLVDQRHHHRRRRDWRSRQRHSHRHSISWWLQTMSALCDAGCRVALRAHVGSNFCLVRAIRHARFHSKTLMQWSIVGYVVAA